MDIAQKFGSMYSSRLSEHILSEYTLIVFRHQPIGVLSTFTSRKYYGCGFAYSRCHILQGTDVVAYSSHPRLKLPISEKHKTDCDQQLIRCVALQFSCFCLDQSLDHRKCFQGRNLRPYLGIPLGLPTNLTFVRTIQHDGHSKWPSFLSQTSQYLWQLSM
jgi:hypothetical protein